MTALIDRQALQSISALQRPGKPDLLARIVGLFRDDAPSVVAKIGDAIEADDLEGVRVHAHTLKSSAAYVGAIELSKRLGELEAAARDGNPFACIALGDGLADLVGECLEGLDELVPHAA